MIVDNTMPIPLYHGTDKKILDYSVDERVEIQNLCDRISQYTYPLFVEDGLSVYSSMKYKGKRLPKIGESWIQFYDAFQKYDSRNNNSELYQYGSIYLTGDRSKAESYARNAFILGEQGYIAYRLYSTASKIWNLKKCTPSMNSLFMRFEKLIEKPRIPVLLTFNGISKNDLLRENGKEIDWEMWGDVASLTRLSFRLKTSSTISIRDGRVEYI